MQPWPDLPILPLLEPLLTTLGQSATAILTAPPGSGKSTLVPLALLNAPWLQGQKIILLQPRRLAARAIAQRMAQLLGEEVGERVGYQVRFDRRISAKTMVEVVTEGILTRRLQQDPALHGVGVVIFDEFHQRSLQSDLGLALCLEVLQLREGLRLLIMSATLQVEPLVHLLQGAPVLAGEGRVYPVTHHYWDYPGGVVDKVVRGVRQAVSQFHGDILAFLPGGGEIRAVQAQLTRQLPPQLEILPLYGDLGHHEQQRVMHPSLQGQRRIILATDIAETSLTLPGITTVVDGGYCRRPRFHPGSGLSRLETMRICRDAAEQRAGRAGRLQAGFCCRLWSADEQEKLALATPPEIMEADLAPLMLDLALWGVRDPNTLPWLDPPPAGAVAQARELLQRLGALDQEGRISAHGRQLAALPLHPRLAHMLVMAKNKATACDLAAILEERDPLRGRGLANTNLQDRLEILTLFRQKGTHAVAAAGGEVTTCQRIQRAALHYRRLLGITREEATGESGLLLATAYPDRIALQRSGANHRYLLANGRGVVLPEGDPLTNSPLLVVADLDGGQLEGKVYLAAPLSRDTFQQAFASQIIQQDEVTWDGRQERVVCRRRQRYESLELATLPLENPSPEAVQAALLAGIRQMGVACLNWSKEARSLQARVALVSRHRPQEALPDLSDATLLINLEEWLAPHLTGCNRKEHLQRLAVAPLLIQQLTWKQRELLEEGTPSHWQVASGSRIPIQYSPEEPPILAVRIQEMFGLVDTPALCWGQQPLTLHLLSPAQRPVQITRDLRGFWQRTWPEVRRELQGRYPKHYWPEDPWSAQATARAKPRK